MSNQRPILFGNKLSSQSSLQSWVKSMSGQNKVYGLPWDLFPPLNNESGYHEKIRPIIEGSTIVFEYDIDKDVFGKIYEKLPEISQMKKIWEFLTSEQYEIRKEVQNNLNGSKITIYTNLVTQEEHTNLEFEVSNNFTNSKPVMEGTIMKQIVDQQQGQLGINSDELIRQIGGLSDFTNKLLDTIQGNNDELRNSVQSVMGSTILMTNLMRMLTREGIKLWSSGEFTLSSKFRFKLRQVSPDQLDQVYVPLFWLLLQSTPHQKYVGYDGDEQYKLQLTVTEKSPPLDVKVYIQNGTLYLEHQQIKSVNVELYDLKPLPPNQNGIPGEIKGGYTLIPTQQDVEVTIESLLPLQFVSSLNQDNKQPLGVKNVYSQLPIDLFK